MVPTSLLVRTGTEAVYGGNYRTVYLGLADKVIGQLSWLIHMILHLVQYWQAIRL